MKKILLTLGAAASAVAPIATVVACGTSSKGKYDAENDGKVTIWTTFTDGGTQDTALQTVIDEYNKETKVENSIYNGAQEVEKVRIDGGYTALSSTLSTKLQAGDKKTLANVLIGYPDTIGTISYYDMHLDLGVNSDIDDFGIDSSIFSEDFTSVNDEIGGIEEGGTYAIPFSKSIDMTTINKPVLAYLLKEMEKAGATISGEMLTLMETEEADVNSDYHKNHIKDSFVTKDDVTSSTLDGYEVDGKIITHLENMIDFAINAIKIVTPKDDSNNKAYILGMDSMTNIAYSMGYSMGDADFDKFYFNKGEDGYIDYKFNDTNSEGYKNFKVLYEKLAEAFKNNAVFVRGEDDYSSVFSKANKMAISMGSTAGYSYNYQEDAQSYSAEMGTGDDAEILNFYKDDTLFDITKITGSDEIATVSSYNNKIYATKPTDASKYDYQLAEASLENDPIFTDSALQYVVGGNKEDEIIKDIKKIEGAKLFAQNDNDDVIYLVPTDKLIIGADEGDSLQENEMEIKNNPFYFTDGDAKTSLVQGPSMFALHSNTTQNTETRKFMKWLYEDGELKLNDDDTDFVTPAEYFATKANYIIPTTEFLDGAAEGNVAQQLTFNTLKNIQNNDDEYGFDNPVDHTTSGVRDVIKSTYAAAWEHINDGNSRSFDEFMQLFKNNSADAFK